MKTDRKNAYFRQSYFFKKLSLFHFSFTNKSCVPNSHTRNRVQKDKAEKQHQSAHWQPMCECKKHANPRIQLFELPEELQNTRENFKDFIFGSGNVWKKEKMRKTIFVDPVFIGLVDFKGHKLMDDTHYI